MDPKRTPGKLMQNILLEKAVQGKFPLSCDSPFRLFPSTSTPPSRLDKIKNPFEPQLTERLHQYVFSPSVFRTNENCKTENKFKWTIEEISDLNPADIDETAVEQFEASYHDKDVELAAQKNIEKYFNENHAIRSPFDPKVKPVRLISESTSPIKAIDDHKECTDGVAQTILTLPPNLPEQIEELLKPYFSYTVDQQQNKDDDDSLQRKLFNFNDQVSAASVLTSPAPSSVISPINISPFDDDDKREYLRNSGCLQDISHVTNWNLSAISENSRVNFLIEGLNFSDRMSVDASMNIVPDTLDQMPSNNQSLLFESLHVSVEEDILSNSPINWEMEYRHVSLASPKSHNSSLNDMDISTSNTPKSKIFMSQRKKLSDSFLRLEHDNKENAFKEAKGMERRSSKNLFVSDDTGDIGYCTGNGLTMSEESWSSPQLFASTPTKIVEE